MVARAEQYTEAHGWQNFSKGASATEKPKTTFKQPIQNSDLQPPAGTKRQPEKYCFLCSRSGHSTETCRVSNSNKGDTRKNRVKYVANQVIPLGSAGREARRT
ncbi:hypothetical protein HPB50_013742 [Hyalomma asiaticum]|uniref:Uncharacterized protein n=1 Tax=Hyalomma asiaticum TaxID=266040 RepID=A0ACB7SES9_HYAAI|nr:hypothetical protein HPB50_013742 [Hyalomma asiaticum]